MPLCLGGNSAELCDCSSILAILGAEHHPGVIWSARTALVDPFCWGSTVWNSRNSCSVAGEFAWRFLVAGLKLAPSILYFPSVQNPVNARVCPKQSWSWYTETPSLGAALWTLAGLHFPGCGVCSKERVFVCVHVCAWRLCVYVQDTYIYWLV